MANIFQKLGLIEVDKPVEEVPIEVVEEPAIEVNVEGVNADDTVKLVYEVNGLSDVKESIFAAENFMNTLPVEMPKDAKRASVLGILTAAGMNKDVVLSDGMRRLTTLEAFVDRTTKENDHIIARTEQMIAELVTQIEAHKETIYNTKAQQAQMFEQIDVEYKRIVELIRFLEGDK